MKGTLDGLVRGLRPRTFNKEKFVNVEAGVPSDRCSFEVAPAFEELPAMGSSTMGSVDVPEWLGSAGSAEPPCAFAASAGKRSLSWLS